jgi:hypothetical protein
MTTYRAFRLDNAGRPHPVDWLVALNDADAAIEAEDLCDAETSSIELWQGSRFVAAYVCAG